MFCLIFLYNKTFLCCINYAGPASPLLIQQKEETQGDINREHNTADEPGLSSGV